MWVCVRDNKIDAVKNILLEKCNKQSIDGHLKYGDVKLAKIFRLMSKIVVDRLNKPTFDPCGNHPCEYKEWEAVKFFTDLTGVLVYIAKTSSLDEEIYVLEDMVCPLMGLLEHYEDPQIISNVKEFIKILHY